MMGGGMYGTGYGLIGGGLFGILFNVAILIAVVVLVVWAVQKFSGSGRSGLQTGSPNQPLTTREILDIRYARSELTREGKELAQIRAFIDNKYSQYGPPTNTEPVQADILNPIGPAVAPVTANAIASCAQSESILSCEGN